MAWLTESSINRYFDPPPSTEGEREAVRVIRQGAKALAMTILRFTPQNSDQSAAIRQLREATATAIGAIRCRVRDPQSGDGDRSGTL